MRKELVPTCSEHTKNSETQSLTCRQTEKLPLEVSRNTRGLQNIQGSPRDRIPSQSLLTEERSEPLISNSASSLFAPVLQHARTVSKKGQMLLCEVPSTYTPTHTFSSSYALTSSSCLSFYLSLAHTNFERTERGGREGLAAAMKDCDEGAAVKYTVDVIYLLMERTHHTDTISFKFSLSKHEPNIDQHQKRMFRSAVWFLHEGTHTNTSKQTDFNSFLSLFLQLQIQFH